MQLTLHDSSCDMQPCCHTTFRQDKPPTSTPKLQPAFHLAKVTCDLSKYLASLHISTIFRNVSYTLRFVTTNSHKWWKIELDIMWHGGWMFSGLIPRDCLSALSVPYFLPGTGRLQSTTKIVLLFSLVLDTEYKLFQLTVFQCSPHISGYQMMCSPDGSPTRAHSSSCWRQNCQRISPHYSDLWVWKVKD